MRSLLLLVATCWFHGAIEGQTVVDVDGALTPDPAHPTFRVHTGGEYALRCHTPAQDRTLVDHPGHLCTAELHDEDVRAVRFEVQAFGFKVASRNRPVRPAGDTIRLSLGDIGLVASELPRVWQVRAGPSEGLENFTLSLRNPRERTVLIDRMRITGYHDPGVRCSHGGGDGPLLWRFELLDTLRISGQVGNATNVESAVLERTAAGALVGLDLFATPVSGAITTGDCGDYSVVLDVPTAIALPADRTGTLMVSLPNRIEVVGPGTNVGPRALGADAPVRPEAASPSNEALALNELTSLTFFLDVADPEELDMLVDCGAIGESRHELRIHVSEERPGGEPVVTELRSMEIRMFRPCEAVQNIDRINNGAVRLQRARVAVPPSSPNPILPDPA